MRRAIVSDCPYLADDGIFEPLGVLLWLEEAVAVEMLDESVWRLPLASGGVLITEDRGPFEISLSKGTDFDWILAFR